MKQTKVWGTTEDLFSSGLFEAHRIEAKEGGYCSWHKHDSKYNGFLLVEGQMEVVAATGPDDGDLVTALLPGELFIVPPGVWHQFQTDAGATVIELYWPAGLNDFTVPDIVRDRLGGVVEE